MANRVYGPKLQGPKLKYRGAGKGSKRRPMFITIEQYGKNYDRAFGKKGK
jgi:hypothetical protein